MNVERVIGVMWEREKDRVALLCGLPRLVFRPLFPAIDLKNEIMDDLVYEASPGA